MRAMILAAGRGQRMGSLTQHCPKPLLRVGGYYLIEYVFAALKRAGIHDIVMNLSYCGEQIKAAIGDGKRYGMTIVYSVEPERLETGGGIIQALPLLGHDPFLVMSSDIITDYPLQRLQCRSDRLAHLLLVDNPLFHSGGDFGLQEGHVTLEASAMLTFANVGLYHPELFMAYPPGYLRLANILLPAITQGLITGEHYRGMWYNVGSPQVWSKVNTHVQEENALLSLLSDMRSFAR